MSLPDDATARGQSLSLTWAAKRLGIDPKTVRTWAEHGLFPVLTDSIGRSRYPKQGIEEFAAKHRLDLDFSRREGPCHFTPAKLAGDSKGDLSTYRIRRLIDAGLIVASEINYGSRRTTILISQKEGFRVLSEYTKQQAG